MTGGIKRYVRPLDSYKEERMYDPRPHAPRTVSSQDVYVDDRGYCFLTDYNAGLYVVELEEEARQLAGLGR